MAYTEIVTCIKDLVLAASALTGAIVAFKGLGTWQRQLKGQSEYELSRRILVTLFKYRDAIYGVRHPAIWSNEMPTPAEDKVKKMNDEQKFFYGISEAYSARWNKVQIERTLLYADLLEAEAIWGDELKNLFKKIFDLENELVKCIRHYLLLRNPDADEASKEAIREIGRKNRDILYDDLSDKPDEYKRDLLSAIEKVEKYLKPNLSHIKV